MAANSDLPIRKRIVLVGGGHAHVLVMRAFGMRPEPGVALTLVAKDLDAAYSGMLPGLVAGHYTHEDCHIDLVRLAQVTGTRLIHDEAIGIDRSAKRLLLRGRPSIAYDTLSIDVGITPLLDGIAGAETEAIAVKPVADFSRKWRAVEAAATRADGPRRFCVIGAGAAGLELILAMRHRLGECVRPDGAAPEFSFTLVGAGLLLPTHNRRARALAREALASQGVQLVEHETAVAISDGNVNFASGRKLAADAILITTRAAAPEWLAATGLSCDAKGFLALRPTLQSLDDDDVFAAGDCATVLEHPREKAGVFAVRQGPPLTENLRRQATGQPTLPFVPQRRFLTLLSLGGKRAIAARGPFAIEGTWVWHWKDRIDRDFMAGFAEPTGMAEPSDEAMRCGGCAAKVGPDTLSRALDRIAALDPGREPPPRDDAAVVDTGGPEVTLETIDFFRAFWPDPFVLGEIAANHAMADIFAMGGRPVRAHAIAVLPFMSPRQTEEDLFQLIAGARRALDREGVELVGGHSSEGPEMAIGFAVSGTASRARLLRKGGLKPGDRLILTRPIGTGLVFAAWMRGQVRAPVMSEVLRAMRASHAEASRILAAHGATAATDVTGFGLAGHLLEMLEASGTTATLSEAAVPAYPSARARAADGLASTLLPENMAFARSIEFANHIPPENRAALLAFLLDPQTAGGLLAGIPAGSAEACLAALRAQAETAEAAIIGEVATAPDDLSARPAVGAGRLRVR